MRLPDGVCGEVGGKERTISDSLILAEKRMGTRPDSAFTVLKKIE